MRMWRQVLLAGTMFVVGCGSKHTSELSPADATEIEQSARSFAATVAHDVTQEGPAAWRRHFADVPSFFMAVDGHMEFADSAAATSTLGDLARLIKQIDLKWGDDMRVDVLAPHMAMVGTSWRETVVRTDGVRVDTSGYFTGLAERRGGHWQFRNAHWSVKHP
jgi:hypothetical protein